MRSYIFTERERRILQAFVNGEAADNIEVSKIMYRFKTFAALPGDVELYRRVDKKRRAAESKATVTA